MDDEIECLNCSHDLEPGDKECLDCGMKIIHCIDCGNIYFIDEEDEDEVYLCNDCDKSN